MADIPNLNEAWNGHSGLEVETFLKRQFSLASASLSGKYGYVEFDSSSLALRFYDQQGGTQLSNIQLGGDVYAVSVDCNLTQTFYVLADEVTKMMTITPSTTVSPFGSSSSSSYPEGYTYTVAVNTGTGYVPRITGTIAINGSATFDIRPFLAMGDNYIRISVTGTSSGQTRTIVYTGTLTSLTMSCRHTWQVAWNEGSDYIVNGIRFAGSLVKVLHVAIDGVELTSVTYQPNQSYTTTATTYTIPSSAFPAVGSSSVHTVSLWMTAQGVSTPVISYDIMCVAFGDTTPLAVINEIAETAVNFTSGKLFSYAVYNADRVEFTLSATLSGTTYPIVAAVPSTGLEEGYQYEFSYALEVDTGANETRIGTMAVSAKAYLLEDAGNTTAASTLFDNTYSYLATPGALFYLNASTRSNNADDYTDIRNEAGASQYFDAVYSGSWSGFSWSGDGWASDADGYKALVVPAGASMSVPGFAPLSLLSNYPQGMTIEMMVQCANPSEYTEPILTMSSGGTSPIGIILYPTEIVVYGSNERSELRQSVNLMENRMTHICITFVKGYEGVASRNLCSIYVNGTSNVNFSFDGSSSFGNGDLTIGQQNADTYLYKLRVYGSALDTQGVFSNFLNSIIDGLEFNRRQEHARNNLVDNNSINYDFCKAAGFNTMVVTMDDDSHPIPSVNNQVSYSGCSIRFEYADAPAKNMSIGNVAIDGQGTTSMKYFRWNLRAKTNDATTWTTVNGTSTSGKTGRMINDENYPLVDRITAKKNYASSMQGHKMGMTSLYNDIYKQLGLGAHLPNTNYQVAVYQFPFVGFKYNQQNNTYEFIGLYTAGPDKNSKVTFGYSSAYPSLLSLEGPNHNPRGTRFLHPWVDIEYDTNDETLKYGGEEGWDCDYVGGGLSSDKAGDRAAIQELYVDEWKPAYEVVFNNSPYIASYQEVITGLNNPSITTLAHLLTVANAPVVISGTTSGVSNQLISFYDSNYELYFYRTKTQKFEKLSDVSSTVEHNVVSSLYSAGYLTTQTPTTAQIISARAARFKATAGSFWDMDQTIYHYCYCIFFGVTDNFAKNSYPFKFRGYSETLPSGESTNTKKWGWRQDDLDTVLSTDNNGRNTKPYYTEHGDLNLSGVDIYQGGDSALWILVRENYQDEIRSMMISMVRAMETLASSLGVAGQNLHTSVFNLVSRYCWEHSAKYFSSALYEHDRRWSYLEPWLINPGQEYNNVLPLDQALGDQYQAERLWVERRIAYMFSKYRIGAFSGTDTNYNGLSITLAQPFTFHVTPAIYLYPVISVGATDDYAGRTPVGVEATITSPAGGATNNYIHGVDWLASLGDMSDMILTDRGGDTDISFSIKGARLQSLILGKASGTVAFNATSLAVESPTITLIDARNVTRISNNVNLLNCPRLRRCLFLGSGATGLLLPVGAKLTEVSFPENAETVFLHSLPFLTAANLTLPGHTHVRNLYINNCASLSPLALVTSILSTTGNTLEYVTITWKGVVQTTSEVIVSLLDLAGRVDFENGSIAVVGGKPFVEGSVSVPSMRSAEYDALDVVFEETYQTSLRRALARLFNTNLYVIYDPETVYISFADSTVESIVISNWGSDGKINFTQAAAVTGSNIGTKFSGQAITSFDEFKYFTGVVSIPGSNTVANGAFANCTSLKSIALPSSVTSLAGRHVFANCSALEEITINSSFSSNTNVFSGCTSLSKVHIKNEAAYLGCNFSSSLSWPFTVSTASSRGLYKGGNLLSHFEIPEGVTTIRTYVFGNINTLTELTIASTVTDSQGHAFDGCSALARINITDLEAFLKIGWNTSSGYPFYSNAGGGPLYLNGEQVTSITVPNTVTELKAYAMFRVKGFTSITLPNTLTSIGQSALCSTNIASITIPSSVTSIGNEAFAYCPNLESIVVPATVTSIGTNIVVNCSALGDATFESTTLAFNFNMIGNVTNSLNGSGTGTLRIKSNATYTAMTQVTMRFKKIICEKNLTMSAGFWAVSNANMTIEQIRIGGNYTTTASSQTYGYIVSPHNNVNNNPFAFFEVMGTITSSYDLIGSTSQRIADGFIVHLGYDAYTNNAVPCTPTNVGASYSRVAKIYVGKGESETEDNNILSVYAADSNWATYVTNGKVDTWYNYVNDPNANPDFID